MKRLFVFGCSFTNWVWPTWADLLSFEFDHYENWGTPSIGNRGISEKIAECHAKNNFSKNDTVIVQWSSHTRFDWYKDIFNKEENAIEGWNVHHDSEYYNKNRSLIEKIYSENAFVMHTLNMMVLVKGLLSSTECEWYMTSLSDIRNLGYDSLFQNRYFNKEHQQTEKIIKDNLSSKDWLINYRFPEFKIYDKLLWNDNIKWKFPMFKNVKENKELLWEFSKDNYVEFHPTPKQHNIWLEKNFKSMLNKDNDCNRQWLIDKFQKLKDSDEYSSDDFRDLCEKLFSKIAEIKYPQLNKVQLGF